MPESFTSLEGYDEFDDELGGRTKRKTKKRKTSAKRKPAKRKSTGKKGKLNMSIVKEAHALAKKFQKAYPESKAKYGNIYGRMYKKLMAGRTAPSTKTGLKSWALGDSASLGNLGSGALKKRKPVKRKTTARKTTPKRKATKRKTNLAGNTTMKTSTKRKPTKRRNSNRSLGQLGRSSSNRVSRSNSPTKLLQKIKDVEQLSLQSDVDKYLKKPTTSYSVSMNLQEIANFAVFAWQNIFRIFYGFFLDESEKVENKVDKKIYTESWLQQATGISDMDVAIKVYAMKKAGESLALKLKETSIPSKYLSLIVIMTNLMTTDSKKEIPENYADAMFSAFKKVRLSVPKGQTFTDNDLANLIIEGAKVAGMENADQVIQVAQTQGYDSYGDMPMLPISQPRPDFSVLSTNQPSLPSSKPKQAGYGWMNELGDDDIDDFDLLGDDEFDDDDDIDFDLEQYGDFDDDFNFEDELLLSGGNQRPALANSLGDSDFDMPSEVTDIDLFGNEIGDVENDFSEDLNSTYGDAESDFSEDMDSSYDEYGDYVPETQRW